MFLKHNPDVAGIKSQALNLWRAAKINNY